MSDRTHTLTAVLPCNDLPASRAFYERLGFTVTSDHGDYLLLEDGSGAELHLRQAEQGWLIPGRNPFGLYLYREEIDDLAGRFRGELLGPAGKPEEKPWGMYEFALSDPDETLVRIGRPIEPAQS